MVDRSHLYERVPREYRDDPSRFALGPQDKVCLDRWLAGETQADIAKALGVSASRVGQRISCAVWHIERQVRREPSGRWLDRQHKPILMTAAEEARWWGNWLRTTRCAGNLGKADDGMFFYRWSSRSGKLRKHIASYDLATFAREVAAWEDTVKWTVSI